jgi:putative oxidoreductase
MRSRRRALLTLEPLIGGTDIALLALRLWVGVFLIWGVWDNIVRPSRMREFAAFLAAHHIGAPGVMAPVSVAVQALCGLAFILGLATRWAGLLCAVNFLVAVVMVDWQGGMRTMFPSLSLVLIGLFLATHGPGHYAVDNILVRRRRVW